MPLQGYQEVQHRAVGGEGGQGAVATQRASAQGFASLSQKLESFSNTALAMSAKSANAQAATDAMSDVYKYKAQAQEIQLDEKMTPSDKQQKLQELAESHEYSGWGQTYTEAYKTAHDKTFMDVVTNEADTAVDAMTALSKWNSQDFVKTWDAYSKGIIESAPNPSLAAATKLTLNKKGMQSYKTLATKEYAEALKVQKQSSDDSIEQLNREYITAHTGNNPDALEIRSQFEKAWQGAVDSGYKTKEQMNVALRIQDEDAMVAMGYRMFTDSLYNQIEGARPVAEQIATIIRSEQYNKLPEDKRKKLVDTMFAEVKSFNSRELEKERAIEKDITDNQDANFREAYVGVLEHDVAVEDIQRAVSNNELTESQGKSLIDIIVTEGIPDNPSRMSYYYKDNKFTELTDEEISEDDTISHKDKKELYQAREKALANEYKWTTSQAGRQAVERVRGLFGFEEGTFSAKFDMANQTSLDYNAMRIALYDEVTSLPEKDQAMQSVNIANRLIKEYQDSKAYKAQEQKQKSLQKQTESWQKKAETYNSSLVGKFMIGVGMADERNAEWYKENK